MSKRINITFTNKEFAAISEKYKQFINGYDFEDNNPPTITGFCAAVILTALQITESSKETEEKQ